jgi:hypothetical protein
MLKFWSHLEFWPNSGSGFQVVPLLDLKIAFSLQYIPSKTVSLQYVQLHFPRQMWENRSKDYRKREYETMFWYTILFFNLI